MAFEEEIGIIRQIRADLNRTREQRVLQVAFDLSALIKLRIQSRGENYQGSPLPPYTPFTVRDRKAKGYQVGYVDYTQTGRLWASVSPRLVSSDDGGVTTVVIESREQRGKDILERAEPKRGNLLLASDEEIKLANDAYNRGVQSIFQF